MIVARIATITPAPIQRRRPLVSGVPALAKVNPAHVSACQCTGIAYRAPKKSHPGDTYRRRESTHPTALWYLAQQPTCRLP